MPIGRDLHIDTPLTNFALQAFQSQQDYVTPGLLPVVNVDKQSNKYYVLDRDSWLMTPASALRSPKAPPRRVEWKVSSDSYFADNYALANEIAKEDLSNADMALMVRERSAEFVTEMLVRDYEQRVATLFTTGANYGTGHVTSLSTAGTQWTAVLSADIRSQITSAHAAIRSDTGMRANTLIVDFDSYQLMSQNARLLANFAYTAVPGQLTEQQLKDVLSVDRIVVAKGIRNSAGEKAGTSVFSSTNIWGRNAILCYMGQATTQKAMTFATAFRWTPAGVPAAFQAYRYDDPDPGKKVEVVEVGYYQDERIVAPALGYLLGSTG